jgi:hypothetical protein
MERRHGGSVQELAQRIVPPDIRPLGRSRSADERGKAGGGGAVGRSRSENGPQGNGKSKNMEVAQALREALKKKTEAKRRREEDTAETPANGGKQA